MFIECILRRKGGTHVRLDDTDYHFDQIGSEGEHVADVENKKHIGRFLSITEGFQVFDGDLAKDMPLDMPPPVAAAPQPRQEPPAAAPQPRQEPPAATPHPQQSTVTTERTAATAELGRLSDKELVSQYGKKSRYALPFDGRTPRPKMLRIISEYFES